MYNAYLNLINHFIVNKKSILTDKEGEKLSPNWIYIKGKKKIKTFYLSQLKALSIQLTGENETWWQHSWGHLHLSWEASGNLSLPTSTPLLPSQPLGIRLNVNESKQPEYKKLSQDYKDRQEKTSLFSRKHLLKVLGSQKSGQNREKLPWMRINKFELCPQGWEKPFSSFVPSVFKKLNLGYSTVVLMSDLLDLPGNTTKFIVRNQELEGKVLIVVFSGHMETVKLLLFSTYHSWEQLWIFPESILKITGFILKLGNLA